MKLLLTSNGLCNKTIVNALADLLGKPFEKSSIAFIPTAANVEVGDKRWLINDLENLKNTGFKKIDIVDISTIPDVLWQTRLESVDVLLIGGGNPYHLMYWIKKSGFDKFLKSEWQNKVYIGISAGSMVMGKRIILTKAKRLDYPDAVIGNECLGFVNFSIRPHLNSPTSPKSRKDIIEKAIENFKETVYALDDESAVKVDGNKVEVVTEGEYLKFN